MLRPALAPASLAAALAAICRVHRSKRASGSQEDSIMRRRSLTLAVALLFVLRIGIAAVATAASDIHIVDAAAAAPCSFPPCTDDHREGHFAIGAADGDFASIDSVADSAYGIMNIQIGYRWLQGASPPSTFTTEGDTLE